MEGLMSFLTLVLESNDVLVERKDGGRIEALLPRDIATSLGIREYQTFCFDSQEAHSDDLVVTYDSDLIDRLSVLLERKGQLSQIILPGAFIRRDRAEESLRKRLVLNNAVYRIKDFEEKRVAYRVFNLKYTAISDEKREDIITIIINEATLSFPEEMLEVIGPYLREGQEPNESIQIPSSRPIEEVYRMALRVLRRKIGEELSDFERSMNRRLKKDILRLEDYYETIKEEIRQKIAKKNLEGKHRKAEESRLKATEVELERRIKDQIEKYSVKVESKLINALRVIAPSALFNVELQRKKEKREVKIGYNPLLKKIEYLSCEGCLARGCYLCDDLHVLCQRCFFKCPGCEKTLCRVCYPDSCPRCKGTIDSGL